MNRRKNETGIFSKETRPDSHRVAASGSERGIYNGYGPGRITIARVENNGVDSIDTTKSRHDGWNPTGTVIKLPEEIPEMEDNRIFWFADYLDLIKKKIEWLMKWLDEIDRHITVLPYRGYS